MTFHASVNSIIGYVCNCMSILIANEVDFTGNNICSFLGADIDDVFKENVLKAKYDKPTPIQKWAIPSIMKGRDLMACAQTGSGKTVSFPL